MKTQEVKEMIKNNSFLSFDQDVEAITIKAGQLKKVIALPHNMMSKEDAAKMLNREIKYMSGVTGINIPLI